jgi:hypothetical protein
MSTTEAKRAGITSLADRPNDVSRYGGGGLSAAMLKERFDALPNLVREKFNKIAEMLAGTDAAKYITLGGEDNALGETLFDFLALFGPRGDGITDKNISDLIETLYQGEGDEGASSRTLKDIVASICARLVALKSFADGALGGIDIYVDGDGGIVYEATDRNGLGVNLTKLDPIGKAGIRDGAVGFEKLDSELGGRIVHVENFAFEAVSYNAETGVLTFKAKNGGEKTVDLPLELIVDGGSYEEETECVVLTLANGEKITIPLSRFADKIADEIKTTRTGSGMPSESTPGRVGDFYMDTATGRVYKCVSVNDGYVWSSLVDVDEISAVVNEKLGTLEDELVLINEGGVE